MRARLLAMLVVLGGVALPWLSQAAADELAVGDSVPEFRLVGAGDLEYRARDFRGRRAFVLAWFPMAFTQG